MKTKLFFFGVLFCNQNTNAFVEIHGDVTHYDFKGAEDAVNRYADSVVSKCKSASVMHFPPVITEVVEVVD